MRVNVILFVMLVVVAVQHLLHSGVAKHFLLGSFWSDHLDKIAKVITIFRDIIYVFALLVAAVWTYYTFIKGRTFIPRLNIAIELRRHRKRNWPFVILGVKIKNIGKSKARIGSEKMSVEYGYVQDGRLTYVLINEGVSILKEHLRSNEYVFLEPSGVSTLEVCLPLSSLEQDAPRHKMPDILRVKMELVCDAKVFREIAIIDLSDRDGGS